MADTPHTEDVQVPVPIWQRLMREPGVIAATSQIICAYGAVLEMIYEGYQGYRGQRHRLLPESMLPHPKETIRAALALSFLQLEWQGWPRRGISPAQLLAAAQTLDLHFAPDREVPAHPTDNWLAFMRRLRSLSSVPAFPAPPRITADTMGWVGLLVMAGVPKDRRDTLIKVVREAT
jgi:transposase